MTDRIELAGHFRMCARELPIHFVADEALPGTGLDETAFWQRFCRDRPRPRAEEPRAARQARRAAGRASTDWHRDNGAPADLEAYKAFLREIGYLVPEGPAFRSPPPMSIPRSPWSPGRSWSCR